MNKFEFGKRLEQERIKQGFSKTEIWKAANVSSGMYTQWINGSVPKYSTVVLIAEFLKVSPNWLIYGKVDKNNQDDETNTYQANALNTVPLVSWVKAGNWSDVTDHLADDGVMVETTYRARAGTFALIVDGSSMEPKFPNGCTIIVEPSEHAINGSYVIVRQNGDKEATFKQLVIEGGRKYLKALNPEWPKRVIEMTEDAVICGVVKRIEMEV